MEECSVLIYPLIMSSSIYYGTRPHRCNNAPKIKNWCQNGVKSRFAKKSQKISTHLLTVLIIGAIVQLEQRKRDKESEI